jgi:hypothetical protein
METKYPNSSYKLRATYLKRTEILAKKMFITCEPMYNLQVHDLFGKLRM